MHPSSQKLKGVAAILVATLFWGMTFAFIRQAVATLSPANFLFWRFGIAALVLLFIIPKKPNQTKKTVRAGGILAACLMGTVLFQSIGLQTTPASVASFITGFAVILVPIIESISTGKWPTKKTVSAACLALLGIGLISLRQGAFSFTKGDLWILACAISFAFYIYFAGLYSKRFDARQLVFYQCISICLMAGLIALLTKTGSIPREPQQWISILFCAFFASIIAFLLQLKYQKYLTASSTAVLFSLEPIFATLTAMILLGERPDLRFYAGALCIFGAILLSELSLKKSSMPQD